MPTMTRKVRIAAALAALVLFATMIGCKGFFVNPTLTTITVTPPTPQIEIGKTLQMTATGTFDDGSVQTLSKNVAWTSDNEAVASVGASTGLITATGTGSATIAASSATATGSTSVSVVLANVTSIQVSPGNVSIKQNASQSYTAMATVTGQTSPVDITATATWSLTVSGSAVPTGLFTTSNSGTAEVVTPQSGAFTSLPYTVTVNASYPSSSGGTVTGTALLTITQ
jgi:uncharacterized protein YjdB